MLYFSLKLIYKYMTIDPSHSTAWSHDGDFYTYYWMKDNVNVFGAVSCVGYKQHIMHFFIDFCGGVGLMSVDHDINLYGIANYPSTPEFRFDPPQSKNSHEKLPTLHFSIKLEYSFF